MTWRRYIFAGLLPLTVFALAAVGWYQARQSQAHVLAQATQELFNAATLLGQALGPSLERGDFERAKEVAKDAVNRAVFSSVELRSRESGVPSVLWVVVRDGTSPEVAGGASSTEVSVRLQMALGRALDLNVRADAPRSLALVRNNIVMLVLGGLVLVLTGSIVVALVYRRFHAQLQAIEQNLLAAANGNYNSVVHELEFGELQQLAAAANTAIHGADAVQQSTGALIERLRNEAYTDAVTGLVNRRALLLRLESLRHDAEACQQGALVLVRLEGLKEYNQRFGLESGDELLAHVAGLLTEHGQQYPQGTVARSAGADMALLLPCLSADELQLQLDSLSKRILTTSHSGVHLVDCAIGAAYYRYKKDIPLLLSTADSAVRLAQQKGDLACHITELDADKEPYWARDDAQWRHLLENALANDRLALVSQPVLVAGQEKILHQEIFVRLIDDRGELIPASVFFPFVDRFGLAARFDAKVIEGVIRWLNDPRRPQDQVAVNLSAAVFTDAEFRLRLYEQLAANPRAATSLLFEFSEYIARGHHDLVREVMAKLKALGAGCSLDHFGVGYTTMGYLRTLPIDYVKIDAGFTKGIEHSIEHRNTVKLMIEFARDLAIKVIAESVETEAEWRMFMTLGVDGGRGFLLGQPERILPESTQPTQSF